MKPTKAQVELGSRYLAMSNMCTLDQFRSNIKDLPSLKQAVYQAWENAVTGIMEGEEGGYNDRHESKAIRAVEAEIKSFRADFRAGGTRAQYWIDKLDKEIPYWREEGV